MKFYLSITIFLLIFISILLIFPIHISNIFIIDGKGKIAKSELMLYKFIKLKKHKITFNSLNDIKIDDKEQSLDFNLNYIKILKQIKILKFLVLTEFGTQSQSMLISSVIYNAISTCFITLSNTKNKTVKIKKYIVYNCNKQNFNSIMYVSFMINLLTILKIMIILIKEKYYANKRRTSKQI